MLDRQPSDPVVPATPFLKWAGGKGSLLPQYEPFLPDRQAIGRYVEPFVGGGAVFFRLQPPRSRLADVNAAVIETYEVVRDRVEELIAALAEHHNDRAHFERVRDLDPESLDPVARAARFIFLNRTCYNGLYRVNRQGRFNVPFGRYKKPRICDPAGLRAAGAALRQVELVAGDFAATTADLGPGDFVYFDPPYAPTSPTANFTKYAPDGFDQAQQARLAEVYRGLAARGCRVMLSNADTPLVRDLYARDGLRLTAIRARRAINSDPAGRGHVTELLVTNYAPGEV